MRFFQRSMFAVLTAAWLLIYPVSVGAQDRDIRDLQQEGKRPTSVSQPEPVYPNEMARAGLTGVVEVSFIINTQGGVENPYVVRSNNPWFERPAIEAVLKWKFTPGEMKGRPVNVRAQQRIEFRLPPGDRASGLWTVSKGKNHKNLPPEFQWDKEPVPVNTRFPVYPFGQLQAHTSGKASIYYVVGPQGRVVQAKLLEATDPAFGAAVLAMIDAWEFTPPKLKNGTPCYAQLRSEYEFKASGNGDVPVGDEARDLLRDLEKKPEKIVTLKDLDQPLKPLSRRPPVYPTSLLEEGKTGEATIDFFVDKNGDAQLPQIMASTAPAFGYAAAQAVATWRFEVPKKGGKPVMVRARIPIQFSSADLKPPPGK